MVPRCIDCVTARCHRGWLNHACVPLMLHAKICNKISTSLVRNNAVIQPNDTVYNEWILYDLRPYVFTIDCLKETVKGEKSRDKMKWRANISKIITKQLQNRPSVGTLVYIQFTHRP